MLKHSTGEKRMKIFNILISLLVLIFLAVACFPFNEIDPDKPVVATPGQTQPTPMEGESPQDNMVQGQVFLGEMQLLIMESFPVQIALHVQGGLPTPCHVFEFTIAEPNEKNEIHVDAFSLVSEGAICVQVMQPFEETVSLPMVGQPDGKYSVWVNGEKVGEFSYPG
jgi:hypothetical protein